MTLDASRLACQMVRPVTRRAFFAGLARDIVVAVDEAHTARNGGRKISHPTNGTDFTLGTSLGSGERVDRTFGAESFSFFRVVTFFALHLRCQRGARETSGTWNATRASSRVVRAFVAWNAITLGSSFRLSTRICSSFAESAR